MNSSEFCTDGLALHRLLGFLPVDPAEPPAHRALVGAEPDDVRPMAASHILVRWQAVFRRGSQKTATMNR